MTPAERRLWNCLRANRLGGLQFRRQQVIDGFIVDFYCHAAAVVVEVDGPVHDDRADYDAERDRILTARGLRVVRFTNEQVNGSLPTCCGGLRGGPTDATRPAHSVFSHAGGGFQGRAKAKSFEVLRVCFRFPCVSQTSTSTWAK